MLCWRYSIALHLPSVGIAMRRLAYAYTAKCRTSLRGRLPRGAQMQQSCLTCSSKTTVHTLRTSNLPARTRVSAHRAVRKAASRAATPSGLNKVLFTIPWKVEFGESLCVSGEGSELGQWDPEQSLPLKWNEGDLWAAEIPLPSG